VHRAAVGEHDVGLPMRGRRRLAVHHRILPELRRWR
jgi:hypothetical protein